MSYLASKRYFEILMLSGLTIWMSLACLNNIMDMGTNIHHLQNMISMTLLKNTQFGKGLIWRAWSAEYAIYLLYFIIFIQIVVSTFLWRAVYSYIKIIKSSDYKLILRSRKDANIALTLFAALWFFFLCGGLWFGYWIKQGAIQKVHMTLLLITIGVFILINLPDPSEVE